MKRLITITMCLLFSVALIGQNTTVSTTLLRTDGIRTYKQSYIHHYDDEYFASDILSHPTNFSNFMGTDAGAVNTGEANIFFGYESGKINVGGRYNTGMGYKTLNFNITGDKLTCFGYMAGYSTTVSDNTFIGYTTGYSTTTGADNTFIGSQAGFSNTIGFYNIFLGKSAGHNTIDGNSNIMIGQEAGYTNTSGVGCTFIGYKAGHENTTASDNYAFGYNALYANQTGTGNIAIGGAACLSATKDMNIGIGSMSLEYMTDGYRNIGIGDQSGNRLAGGDDNVFIGMMAGYWNIGGNYNVILGNEAGEGASPGAAYSNNTFNGYKSGFGITTGSDNTYIGYNTGKATTTGGTNTFIGSNSGYSNVTGGSNTSLGYSSLYSLTDNNQNTAIGSISLYSNLTGQNNTALGYGSGYSNTGDANVFLGFNAGYNEIGSNKLYIENSNSATPLIGGDFSTDDVTINGDLSVTDSTFTNTIAPYSGTTTTFPQILTVQGNTNLGNASTDLVTITGKSTFSDTAKFANYIGINMGTINAAPMTWLNIRTGATANDGLRISGYSSTTSDVPVFCFGRSNSATLGTPSRTLTGTYMGRIANYAVTMANTWGTSPSSTIDFYANATAGNQTATTTTLFQGTNSGNSNTLYTRVAIDQFGKTAFSGLSGKHATFTPTYTISLNGEGAQTMGVERTTTANTAGAGLTFYLGGASSGATDKGWGMFTLAPLPSTGTGTGSIRFQRMSRAETTGTADNTATDAMIIPSSKICADNTSTTLFNVSCAAGTSYGITVEYSIKTVGGAGNESHIEVGTLYLMGGNDGAVTVTSTKASSGQHKTDAGAYTVTFTATTANPSVISVTADSELNVSSTISYNIVNTGNQTITQL